MELIKIIGHAGISLAAEAGGNSDNQAILLLHNHQQTRHEWAPLARRLMHTGFYVVSLDLRGHGDSGWSEDYSLSALADDVHAVLQTLPGKPVVIGSGLGGKAALLAAGRENQRSGMDIISAMIMIDVHSRSDMRLDKQTLYRGGRDLKSLIDELSSHIGGTSNTSMLHKYLRLRTPGVWHWHSDPGIESTAAISTWPDIELEQATATLDIPMLLVQGDERKCWLEQLAKTIPGATLLTQPGARQWLSTTAELDGFDLVTLRFIESRCAPILPARADTRLLRRTLGAFATGVTVITTTDEHGKPVGFTANSFTSVSLDPPLVLFCLDKRSASLDIFEKSQAFGINVLNADQQDISQRFASRNEDRFADTPWEMWELKVPIIQNTAASFECAKHHVVDAGDHLIFLGRVHHSWLDSQRSPLLYFQGNYHHVQRH